MRLMRWFCQLSKFCCCCCCCHAKYNCFKVCMSFLRELYLFIWRCLSYIYIFTSLYVPFPERLHWLSTPAPSRIWPSVHTLRSLLNQLNPLSQGRSISPRDQESLVDHSPSSMGLGRKGRKKSKRRGKARHKHDSRTSPVEERDLEEGYSDEAEEEEEEDIRGGKRGYGGRTGRGGGRGGSQIERRDSKPCPPGLPNLGKTCYMNCVLQSLYHLQPLLEALRTPQHKSNKMEVVTATLNLFESLRDGSDTMRCVRRVKRVAAARDDNFKGYEQKDAHDFLAQILDWLHTELADETMMGTELSGSTVDVAGSHNFSSPISRLFRTTKLNSFLCRRTGKSQNETEESALNLSLPVTRDGPKSLKEVIEKSLTQQTMMWDCDACKETHDCEMRTEIIKLPQVLILHLSRVSEAATRHMKLRVSYPEAGLEVDATKGGESRRYRLAAVCCHEGGMDGGHYTAFCRVKDNWFLFNDSIVRPATPDQVVNSPSAHLLFYEAQTVSS